MKQVLTFLASFVSLMTWGQRIQHTELLGRPTDHSVTIQMIFWDSVEVKIDYGTQPGSYSFTSTSQTFLPETPAEIVLNGLQSNTTYYYRMAYRSPNTAAWNNRPEYRFKTQRSDTSSFNFIVQADPHLDQLSDTALYQRCLQNQLDDQPDFMIDLGDFLMSDKLKGSTGAVPLDTITYRAHLLRRYYDRICHSVPLFIALGNHEGECGWYQNGTPNTIPVRGTLERKKYFLNPAPSSFYSGDTTQHPFVGQRENYYSWKWGNSLFIVLDPYWYTMIKPDSLNGWRWTLGKTQYDWLRQTLQNSHETFKFVFAHQIIGGDPDGRGGVEVANLYEWGGNNLNGTPGFATERPGWYKPIKDLLEENRVTIFFHGHDHFFGKQEKDCLIYQETPQPSHPNFTSTSYATAYGYLNGLILPNSGHIRVNCAPNGVRVDYVRAYLPRNENGTRHNKDVSATYFIGIPNCYDSLVRSAPVLWNSNYVNELVYPNPFQHQVEISIELPKAESVSLDIFDQNGKLVRNLLKNNPTPSQSFMVVWDGTNSQGLPMPDGLYYYRWKTANSPIKSGKIILKK